MKNNHNNLISKSVTSLIGIICITILFAASAMAQDKSQMVRIAKLQIDPTQLDKYNAALREQMTTAVKIEPGVLTYYAVADKKTPTHISILEIYADSAAYEKHILTPHFLKYKKTVQHMVKSLELVDVAIIGVALKSN